jgi:putative inorganic carbon (HCO3(-)) transporter
VPILRWIDRWHWVFLALAVPASALLLPSGGRSLVPNGGIVGLLAVAFAMLVVPGIWIVGLLARRDPIRQTPFNLSLLLLAVMVLVSLYATYDIAQSLSKIIGMVLAFGVFFAFARISDHFAGWWGAAFVFAATNLGIAAFALLSVQWGAKIPVIGTLVSRLPPRIVNLPGAEQGLNPNEIAGALVWSIPLFVTMTIALLVRRATVSEMLGKRITSLAILALRAATLFVLAILVLSQSRSGYLGLAVGLGAIAFVVATWRWRAVLAAGCIVVVIAAVIFLRSSDANPFSENTSALSAESAINTWTGRVEIWSRAIYGIQDFAFTGMGMNTFGRVAYVLYPLFLISPDMDFGHAHNEFLQAALDLGVPGLIAFAALYFGAAGMLWTIWRHAGTMLPDSFIVRAIALGLGAGLLAHLVYGMTDATLLGSKPGVLFWMSLGLIAGLYAQMQSGDLAKWYEWFGAPVSRDLPPLSNPEAPGD